MSLLKVKKITRCYNGRKGLVFKDFISRGWGRGRAGKAETETPPRSSCSTDSPQPSSFAISPKEGGTGRAEMRFIKTDVLHYCKRKEADTTHSSLCQAGVPKYTCENENGRGNVKFQLSRY